MQLTSLSFIKHAPNLGKHKFEIKSLNPIKTETTVYEENRLSIILTSINVTLTMRKATLYFFNVKGGRGGGPEGPVRPHAEPVTSWID